MVITSFLSFIYRKKEQGKGIRKGKKLPFLILFPCTFFDRHGLKNCRK
ncbi:Uncharacterized protein dnm_022320 [Desulfonema magnum]|uniref:Uncharacterized protein n=1 Tax=Desulfonema magnum TaxID=45655 RepID=A0A975BIZ7_9BACT|nr:Uncharacterized protein dnm_022320 [Desulfonema magnum]